MTEVVSKYTSKAEHCACSILYTRTNYVQLHFIYQTISLEVKFIFLGLSEADHLRDLDKEHMQHSGQGNKLKINMSGIQFCLCTGKKATIHLLTTSVDD